MADDTSALSGSQTRPPGPHAPSTKDLLAFYSMVNAEKRDRINAIPVFDPKDVLSFFARFESAFQAIATKLHGLHPEGPHKPILTDDDRVYMIRQRFGAEIFADCLNPAFAANEGLEHDYDRVKTTIIEYYGNSHAKFSATIDMKALSLTESTPLGLAAYTQKFEHQAFTLNFTDELKCWFYLAGLGMNIGIPVVSAFHRGGEPMTFAAVKTQANLQVFNSSSAPPASASETPSAAPPGRAPSKTQAQLTAETKLQNRAYKALPGGYYPNSLQGKLFDNPQLKAFLELNNICTFCRGDGHAVKACPDPNHKNSKSKS